MFSKKGMFSSIGRVTAVATVAAIALSTVAPSIANAGSAPKGHVIAGTSGSTDFSSRARGRYYRGGGGGGAAAAAAFAGIVGTGLAIAATQNRRNYNDSYGYYDGGPGYYGGPAYYGRPGYSPRSPMYSDGYYGNRFYNSGW